MVREPYQTGGGKQPSRRARAGRKALPRRKTTATPRGVPASGRDGAVY